MDKDRTKGTDRAAAGSLFDNGIDAIEDGVSASSGPTARANGGSGRLAAARAY
jgi:hypothetical protein